MSRPSRESVNRIKPLVAATALERDYFLTGKFESLPFMAFLHIILAEDAVAFGLADSILEKRPLQSIDGEDASRKENS